MEKLAFVVLWLYSFIPVSGFLTGNGYLNYYDVEFPFFSGSFVKYLQTGFVYVPELGINPDPHSVLYLFLTILPTENIIILAKAYLIVVISVIYLLLWKLTDRILLTLTLNAHSLELKVLLILFFYLFPYYLNLLAGDWYTIILGVLALAFVYINILHVELKNKPLSKNDIFISSIALGFSSLMDPRFFVWFIYTILVFVIYTLFGFRNSFKNVVKTLISILLISLPLVGFTYLIYVYPTLISTHSVTFQSLRTDSLSYIAGFSQNALFTFLLAGISIWWPFVVYSSPSILFYDRMEWFYLPTYGHNRLLLVPNDIVSHIWLAFLFTFTIVAFTSLLDRSRRKVAAQLMLIYLFMIGIESGTNFPFLEFPYLFEVLPSHIPLIGGIMAMTFAIPSWAFWINIPIELLLGALGLNYILDTAKTVRRNTLVGVGLFLMMSFVSWQYYNGTLYPSQYTGSFPGNSISLQGYYYPLNPPPQWVHVMKILSTSNNAGVIYIGDIGYSEKWAHYQFISYATPIMPGYKTISLPSIQFINQTPLAFDIAGIRYLFLDNTSYIPLNSHVIYNYLNYSGLKVIYAKGDVYLLEQPNASVFREAKMGIYLNCTNETVLFNTEWLLYPLINYTPAIISPIKVPNTVTMFLNPSVVKSNYISLYNETKNVTVLQGNYTVIANGNVIHLAVQGETNIIVRPWTMVIPGSVNLSELRSYPLNFSFNQFMTQFTVNSDPGYLVMSSLPLPNGSVETSNGKSLGVNGFGQYIFVANGKLTISIKLGFITNLFITLMDLFFYILFIYFIIVKSIIKRNLLEVLRDAITRTNRFKSNK